MNSDEFYLTVTSDSNMDLYPDNMVSEFKIQLAHPIFLPHEARWKVGLASLHYPYDFASIGPDTIIKINGFFQVHEVVVEPSFCTELTDLCTYLTQIIAAALAKMYLKMPHVLARLNTGKHSSSSHDPVPSRSSTGFPIRDDKPPSFSIVPTVLRRTRMSCNVLDFDIGLSPRLLNMLGLGENDRFSVEKFDFRCTLRDAVIEVTGDLEPMSYEEAYRNFYTEMTPYHFGFETVDKMTDKLTAIFHTTWDSLVESVLENDEALNLLLSKSTPQNPAYIETTWRSVSTYWSRYISAAEFDDTVRECARYDFKQRDDPGHISLRQNVANMIVYTVIKKTVLDHPFSAEIRSAPANLVMPYELMYIYSDLVKPEPFNAIMSRLLIIVKTEGTPGQVTSFVPNLIQYKALDKHDISNFKILIAGDEGVRVPFMRGPAVVTLHFVRL